MKIDLSDETAFIDAILESTAHVITTVRKKIDYSMDKDANGRTRVVKHGLKDVTREGFSYELTVDFELINDKHLASASKDRTGLFMDKPEFVINSATGKKLIEWCNQGVSLDDVKKEINATTTLEGLRHLYQKYNSLKQQIHPLIMARKSEIENTAQIVDNKQIINTKTIQQNGISNSNTTGGK